MANESAGGDCIYNHFLQFLGEPLYSEKFEQATDMPSIQILVFGDVFGGCRAFCSFGLSHYRDLMGEVAEVCLAANDGWEESPSILVASMFAVLQNRANLRSGVAFLFREWHPSFQRFASRFDKPAIYITVPPLNLPVDFSRIVCDSEVAQLYFAFYLSQSEYSYYIERGPDKLEDLFEANAVDVFDLHRVSVV